MIGGDTMLRALKSYWAFTNYRYKLIMLVLIPIIFVVVNVNMYRHEIGSGFDSFLILYWIDMASNNHFMNGFYPKGNRALGFMQSSPKFKRTMREVAVVDAVIRVVFYHIPYITLLMCAKGDAEALEFCNQIAYVPWVQALIAQIFLLIGHEYKAEEGNVLTLFGGHICMMIIVILIGWIGSQAGGNYKPVIAVLMVLMLIMIIATARHSDKMMEESYYD